MVQQIETVEEKCRKYRKLEENLKRKQLVMLCLHFVSFARFPQRRKVHLSQFEDKEKDSCLRAFVFFKTTGFVVENAKRNYGKLELYLFCPDFYELVIMKRGKLEKQ